MVLTETKTLFQLSVVIKYYKESQNLYRLLKRNFVIQWRPMYKVQKLALKNKHNLSYIWSSILTYEQ